SARFSNGTTANLRGGGAQAGTSADSIGELPAGLGAPGAGLPPGAGAAAAPEPGFAPAPTAGVAAAPAAGPPAGCAGGRA
ncbi:MAG TPA: hypothetical protein VF469_05640, partial [Kofleriaceae bacterium]